MSAGQRRCLDVLPAEAIALAARGFDSKELPPAMRGRVGQARGALSERRVLSLLCHPARHGVRPKQWLLGARAATDAEDNAGIDVVAHLDVGDVPIQVKCQRQEGKKARRSRRLCREAGGVTVYVMPDTPAATAWGRLVEALSSARSTAGRRRPSGRRSPGRGLRSRRSRLTIRSGSS